MLYLLIRNKTLTSQTVQFYIKRNFTTIMIQTRRSYFSTITRDFIFQTLGIGNLLVKDC